MSYPSFNDENPFTWIFDEPKKNQNSGLNVYVKSPETKRNPRFQFPKCRCPFGVQDGKPQGDREGGGAAAPASGGGRKNLELSVDDAQMVAWAHRVDERMISWITENCQTLFKKEMKQSTVEALYRQLASSSSPDSGYAPLMRIKVNASGKQVTNVLVVRDEGDPERGLPLRYRQGTLDEVTPQCHVIPIVEAAGLWIISKACGFTLVATDLLVFPAAKQGGFAFRLPGLAAQRVDDDGDGDDGTGSNGPEVDASVLAAPTVVGAYDVSMANAGGDGDSGN